MQASKRRLRKCKCSLTPWKKRENTRKQRNWYERANWIHKKLVLVRCIMEKKTCADFLNDILAFSKRYVFALRTCGFYSLGQPIILLEQGKNHVEEINNVILVRTFMSSQINNLVLVFIWIFFRERAPSINISSILSMATHQFSLPEYLSSLSGNQNSAISSFLFSPWTQI